MLYFFYPLYPILFRNIASFEYLHVVLDLFHI